VSASSPTSDTLLLLGISGMPLCLCKVLIAGCSPCRTYYAQYFFSKANVSALRHACKSDATAGLRGAVGAARVESHSFNLLVAFCVCGCDVDDSFSS
jgi:hypothetical protein